MQFKFLTSLIIFFMLSSCIFTKKEETREKNDLALSRQIELQAFQYNGHNFKDLHSIIHNAIKNGELSAYTSADFEEQYKEQEINWRFEQEETVTVVPDPDNPFHEKDSVILSKIEPEDIRFYRIVESFNRFEEDRSFHGEVIGVAPMFNPLVEGEKMAISPLAYLKMEDLSDLLSDEQFEAFKNILIQSIKETDLKNY